MAEKDFVTIELEPFVGVAGSAPGFEVNVLHPPDEDDSGDRFDQSARTMVKWVLRGRSVWEVVSNWPLLRARMARSAG